MRLPPDSHPIRRAFAEALKRRNVPGFVVAGPQRLGLDLMLLDLWPSNGYILPMGKHSVAEAKNRLPELIDRALDGESVVITRHGHPVVELRRIAHPARSLSPAALDWLAARRIKPRSAKQDAGTLVSRMRDEGL